MPCARNFCSRPVRGVIAAACGILICLGVANVYGQATPAPPVPTAEAKPASEPAEQKPTTSPTNPFWTQGDKYAGPRFNGRQTSASRGDSRRARHVQFSLPAVAAGARLVCRADRPVAADGFFAAWHVQLHRHADLHACRGARCAQRRAADQRLYARSPRADARRCEPRRRHPAEPGSGCSACRARSAGRIRIDPRAVPSLEYDTGSGRCGNSAAVGTAG